jgi:hypothetical protein
LAFDGHISCKRIVGVLPEVIVLQQSGRHETIEKSQGYEGLSVNDIIINVSVDDQ